MSKVRNKQPASDTRPARRSMVELTAEASRAVDEALLATPVRLIVDSADHPPRLEPAPIADIAPSHGLVRVSLAVVSVDLCQRHLSFAAHVRFSRT